MRKYTQRNIPKTFSTTKNILFRECVFKPRDNLLFRSKSILLASLVGALGAVVADFILRFSVAIIGARGCCSCGCVLIVV